MEQGGQSIATLRALARVARDGRPWKRGHTSLLVHQLYNRTANAKEAYTDHDHMLAAARWLETAQDAMSDGGVCGMYHLSTGWSSSYPETTGYIIPTFLDLAKELKNQRFVERAKRAVDFL